MKINFLQSLLYGLISGIAEFLPLSATAHQSVLLQMFGIDAHNPLLDFFVHIGLLTAVFLGGRSTLSRIKRDSGRAVRSRSGRQKARQSRGYFDVRLVRTASLPMLVVLSLTLVTRKLCSSMLWISAFLILNGIFLYITDHIPQSNKESRNMSGADGILIGLSAAASALPGVSRIGFSTATGVMRGADHREAYSWALLLSIPAIAAMLVFDVFAMISAGVGAVSLAVIASYTFAAAAAVGGGYLGIRLMYALIFRADFSGFAYYSWGLALYAFILYLIL